MMERRFLYSLIDTVAQLAGLSINSYDLTHKNKPVLMSAFILGALSSLACLVLGITQNILFILRVSSAIFSQFNVLIPGLSVVSFLFTLGFSLRKIKKIFQNPEISWQKKSILLSLEFLKILALSVLLTLTLMLLIHPLSGPPVLSAMIAFSVFLNVINFLKPNVEKKLKVDNPIATNSPNPMPVSFTTQHHSERQAADTKKESYPPSIKKSSPSPK